MNVQDITVDLSKKNIKPESIVLRQGDKNGTTLRVKVLDNGVNLPSLSGYTAKFVMKLPYNRFYYEVEGTINGSIITFVIDESYAAVQSGVTNVAYVVLANEETTKMSANNIRVEILPSALDGFTPAPAWTDPIDQFIEESQVRVDAVVDEANTAIENAEQAAQNANDTAQTVAQGWANRQNEINVTMNSMRTLMTNSANAESQRVIAENARVDAETERVSAESARVQEWNELTGNVTTATNAANEAASNATNAANRADDSSRAANEMISRGNTTITNIGNTANQIFGQAGQAIGEANAAATNANAKAGLADTAASNADTATTAANNAAQTATTAAEQADAAREAIQDDLAAKADKDGYYQQLTAGLADTVAGGTTEIVQFAQRTSDHDGTVRIESLRGNTVRWNQLAKEFSETNYPVTNKTRASFAYDNGMAIATPLTTGLQYVSVMSTLEGASVNPSANHVCFMAADFYTNKPHGARLGNYASQNEIAVTGVNKWVHVETIYTYSSLITERNDNFLYGMNVTETPESGDEWRVDNPVCIDLTLIFGAGNEPATVEEFEQLFPKDYYPYDAGSLLSVNIEGIQSAGTTRIIPVSTYFPDGLRSAGTAYDELDFVNHKAVTRIDSVDLGELNWKHASLNGAMSFYVAFPDAMITSNNNKVANITTLGYSILSADNLYTHTTDTKIMSLNRQHNLQVRDTDYTDAATFKAAMSGVMLYYELATPTETDLPENLQATYPVETGGTESIVIPTGEQSAPPTMAIVYGYTADGVRDETQSIVAPVERGVASRNYGVGSYLVMGGILYRVTTAIATGETINPGTNCIATTVMAELMALMA